MRSIGESFEQHACRALQRAGLRLLQRNYYCRHGELDLVMRHRDTLVFVEVRYRQTAHHGDALASINHAKCRKLILSAQCWLAAHPQQAQRPCRFDVVSFDGPPSKAQLQWHQNVFDADVA